MVAGRRMTCMKYVLFAVNFMFFILGVASVALGIFVLVVKNDVETLTKINKDGELEAFSLICSLYHFFGTSGAIVLIVSGVFFLLLGFLGRRGAFREIKCLLGLVSGVAAVSLSVYLWVDKNDENDEQEHSTRVRLQQSGAIVIIVGGVFIMLLQFLECCGAFEDDVTREERRMRRPKGANVKKEIKGLLD